jgi:hypothetical protein
LLLPRRPRVRLPPSRASATHREMGRHFMLARLGTGSTAVAPEHAAAAAAEHHESPSSPSLTVEQAVDIYRKQLVDTSAQQYLEHRIAQKREQLSVSMANVEEHHRRLSEETADAADGEPASDAAANRTDAEASAPTGIGEDEPEDEPEEQDDDDDDDEGGTRDACVQCSCPWLLHGLGSAQPPTSLQRDTRHAETQHEQRSAAAAANLQPRVVKMTDDPLAGVLDRTYGGGASSPPPPPVLISRAVQASLPWRTHEVCLRPTTQPMRLAAACGAVHTYRNELMLDAVLSR